MQNKAPAGFFVRLCAYIMDRAIFFALFLIFRLIGGITTLIIGGSGPKALFFEFTVFDIISTVLVWGYFVFFTYSNGCTLGKYLMNIRVESVEEDRKPTFIEILIRETVGRFLSSILFIGYIMIGVDERKLGLHDRICDTRVVYVAPRSIPVREPKDSVYTGYYRSSKDTNVSDNTDFYGSSTEPKVSQDIPRFYQNNDNVNLQNTERKDETKNEED